MGVPAPRRTRMIAAAPGRGKELGEAYPSAEAREETTWRCCSSVSSG